MGAFLLPVGLSGCQALLPGACTLEMGPAVIVEVRDAATHAPAALGASGHVQDGAFREDLNRRRPAADPLTMYGPYERPGTYTVVVEKPGYRTWTQKNVRVRKDRCHVQTQTLQVNLQPQS